MVFLIRYLKMENIFIQKLFVKDTFAKKKNKQTKTRKHE